MGKTFGNLASEIIGITDELAAYNFNAPVLLVGVEESTERREGGIPLDEPNLWDMT